MDSFGESGKPMDLLKKYGLTADNIVEKAKLAFSKKR
jgi:transketolase